LRDRPNLDQLRRQAKELLHAFLEGEAGAAAEVNEHFRDADRAAFALHDAQLVLARSYGFESWPKLKAYVDGVTVHRLADAVRAGDIRQVRAMLKARPELVNMDMAENNEHHALHYAVFKRDPDMVRVLMQHGADARTGIYPHRDATTALTLATERGYGEIVAIIQEEERHPGRGTASPRGAQRPERDRHHCDGRTDGGDRQRRNGTRARDARRRACFDACMQPRWEHAPAYGCRDVQ
jgi:hypothetical protein